MFTSAPEVWALGGSGLNSRLGPKNFPNTPKPLSALERGKREPLRNPASYLDYRPMKTIVECVPNFSEGRDRAVIDQITAAIQSVPGIIVMDVEMDADHHRSVITFVGEKDRVGEGALRAIGKASRTH